MPGLYNLDKAYCGTSVFLTYFFMKLPSSVNHSTSGFSRSSSYRCHLLEETCSMDSQVWGGFSLSSDGRRVALLRIWHTLRVTSGESEKTTYYLERYPPVSHWCPLIPKTPCTWYGICTSKSWPIVNLVASSTESTIESTDLKSVPNFGVSLPSTTLYISVAKHWRDCLNCNC